MDAETKIVVWDPDGEYWPGALVNPPTLTPGGMMVDPGSTAGLVKRGVVMLPVEPKLFRLSGVGGYAKREWGSGWPLPTGVSKNFAPLTLYCTSDYEYIHWCVRLMGEGATDGALRIASDASQPNPLRAGLTYDTASHVDLRQLGPVDKHGGWTVGGSARAKLPCDGTYGFSLYGVGNGLRVVFAAMSQAAR